MLALVTFLPASLHRISRGFCVAFTVVFVVAITRHPNAIKFNEAETTIRFGPNGRHYFNIVSFTFALRESKAFRSIELNALGHFRWCCR